MLLESGSFVINELHVVITIIMLCSQKLILNIVYCWL